MKNSFVFVLSAVFFISCSIIKNESEKKIKLIGKVTATDYSIPVVSKLSFNINGEQITTAETNKNGEFNFMIEKKYYLKECQLIVNPLVNKVIMDTVKENKKPIIVLANDLKADTFNIILSNEKLNIKLTNYQIVIIQSEESH